MNCFRIVLFTILMGFGPLALLYSAKRAAGYTPSIREVLTKAEYSSIYHGGLSLEQKQKELEALRKKYGGDPYKLRAIDRAIDEIYVEIQAAR
jgi:hypothetical protein